VSRTPTTSPSLGFQASQRELVIAINRLLSLTDFGSLTNAVDDTAAAAVGVNVGELYRNGSVVMVRVT
jgi:hypothetical protein